MKALILAVAVLGAVGCVDGAVVEPEPDAMLPDAALPMCADECGDVGFSCETEFERCSCNFASVYIACDFDGE